MKIDRGSWDWEQAPQHPAPKELKALKSLQAEGVEPLVARIRELEAELEKRKAELWHYGKHLSGCVIWKNISIGCDCGWVAVRSTLAPAKQSSDSAFNAALAPTLETSVNPGEVGKCGECGASYYRAERIGKPCEIHYCRGTVKPTLQSATDPK